MFYQLFLRPLLFRLDPENAHRAVIQLLKGVRRVAPLKNFLSHQFGFSHPALQFNLLGHCFQNPVGLAAGFDKNCEIFDTVPCFGFGFAECGTITPKPQEGNPKPRIFRMPQQKALINRLGFNNCGAEQAGKHLEEFFHPMPLGINIGKNAATKLEDAVQDYLFVFEKLYQYADYFALNVSSPNTPKLTELQKDLNPLFIALQKKNQQLAQSYAKEPKPVFVKISPDLAFSELDQISESCIHHKITGVILANTTASRNGLNLPMPIEGGLSGRPLFERSREMIRYLYNRAGKKLVLIGVGGVFSAEDAYQKIKAGASLIQLYTGWVYGGPSAVSAINQGLVSLLQRDGLKNIQEAVGAVAS